MKNQLAAILKQQELILQKLTMLDNRFSAGSVSRDPALYHTTDVSGEAFRGQARARVAVIEYGDYECPFCGQFQRDTLPPSVESYVKTGKIRFYYRDFPLPAHPHAMLAAQSARCAAEQGEYWEMHDILYANQTKLSQVGIPKLAATLGLNKTAFADCLKNGKFAKEVDDGISQATKLGISATPTLVLGTVGKDGTSVQIKKQVVGSAPYSTLKSDIDELLAGTSQP